MADIRSGLGLTQSLAQALKQEVEDRRLWRDLRKVTDTVKGCGQFSPIESEAENRKILRPFRAPWSQAAHDGRHAGPIFAPRKDQAPMARLDELRDHRDAVAGDDRMA